MAELLEVLHLPDHHGVTEVKVGRGGIEADFDSERLAARELRPKVLAIDQIDRALREILDLFVQIHGRGHSKGVLCSSLFSVRPPGHEERTTKNEERAGNLTTPRTVSTLAQLYEIHTCSPVAPPSSPRDVGVHCRAPHVEKGRRRARSISTDQTSSPREEEVFCLWLNFDIQRAYGRC